MTEPSGKCAIAGNQIAAADLERWRAAAREAGFSAFIDVAKCEGQSQFWRAWSGQPAGVYFWLGQDGRAYIGQTVQPSRRLREHWQSHGDIVAAAFQRCAKPNLDRLELELVQKVEQHFELRNIKLASWTSARVPLDELISIAEQLSYLAGQDFPRGEWQRRDAQQRKMAKRYADFIALNGAAAALKAVQLYVDRALPRPALTELSFWSVTLLPENKMLRLNIGQQEALTVSIASASPIVRVLTADRVRLWNCWRMQYQVPCYVSSIKADKLGNWLSGKRLESVRKLALRLMRHTQPLNARSHCPQAVRFDVS